MQSYEYDFMFSVPQYSKCVSTDLAKYRGGFKFYFSNGT